MIDTHLPTSRAKVKILVADDDEAIRALVTRLFSRRGDTVEGAADGAAAIARLDAEDFDLMVLDLMMPRTDGIGVLGYLRSRSRPSPRIIVMTAAVPALTASVPRDQIVALVTKPFDIASLLRIADDALARSSSSRSGGGAPTSFPA
jgi:CheY-like chemotaxis protein